MHHLYPTAPPVNRIITFHGMCEEGAEDAVAGMAIE